MPDESPPSAPSTPQPAPPTTLQVAGMLWELARLSVLDEENPNSFKVRAYENAARGVEGYGGEISSLSVDELTEIKGVGKSIAEKIREFCQTGRVKKLEELQARYPPAFVELTRIPGLGPKTLKLLRTELGVEDLEALRAAIEAEQLRTLPGLGATSEAKIARAIERLGLSGKDRRTPIAEALPFANRMAAQLRQLPGVEAAEPCGSLRRFSETIGDIDITVASTDPAPVMEFVASHPQATEVIGHGETKTSILTSTGLQVDVRVVEPAQLGAALLYFTGSKSHNIVLRQRAIERGWLLNEYGLVDKESQQIVARTTEEEIYDALDLAFIPPPLRENTGEVEAAARRQLPDLVELEDIRGDLHYHSDRSGDGRSPLEEMVAAAAERGYQYVAITEHGENLAVNGSSRSQMLAHRERIEGLAGAFPSLRILYGCELNIGREGDLDYDPEFRAGFDWCVASVHSYFDLGQVEQTERLLAVISDPSVNVIGHLTGRYIGRRPGIELDVEAVLEALADTGVGLEVNGALDRLDASSSVIRRAVEKGVRLVISTDSHHTSELVRMRHGVLTAQRGWATKEAVANTLAVDEFLALAGKRKG